MALHFFFWGYLKSKDTDTDGVLCASAFTVWHFDMSCSPWKITITLHLRKNEKEGIVLTLSIPSEMVLTSQTPAWVSGPAVILRVLAHRAGNALQYEEAKCENPLADFKDTSSSRSNLLLPGMGPRTLHLKRWVILRDVWKACHSLGESALSCHPERESSCDYPGQWKTLLKWHCYLLSLHLLTSLP